MIQITPQMRILVAVESVDFRKGIDSLAELCRAKLNADPFSGYLFVFRSRRATSIKVLVYVGQGFWLATKRLSKGRFRWWPQMTEGAEERGFCAWRAPDDKCTGTFTSGVVSVVGAWRIALFFTGWKHAGENIADVLNRRARQLPAPIQMCDALSRNTPKLEGVEILVANCLAHGRRQFVEVVENFPKQCRYVLETLRGVYHNDALALEQGLSPQDRLRFHREHSGPLMKDLHV